MKILYYDDKTIRTFRDNSANEIASLDYWIDIPQSCLKHMDITHG
ncbi:MAG: hypothetical protein ACE5DL_05090 [Nitrosopumilaceae archaeon]